MKILVLDNYDSFTYNLVYLLRRLAPSASIDIYRNDEIALEKVADYDKILLSPGPSLPTQAGILLSLIKQYAATKSILGVCLGHQAIAEAFGGELFNLAAVRHGFEGELIPVDNEELLFKGVPEKSSVGLYHSWAVDEGTLPSCLKVTAHCGEGRIMAIRHQEYDVCGLQFHPESIMTQQGEQILRNWVNGK